MPLTDSACRNAKPTSKPYKLSDSGGLYLYVGAAGGRLWRYDYRYRGRRKTASFGPYPTVSLAQARQSRDRAKEHLSRDVDPCEAKQTLKRAGKVASANTFRMIAEELVRKLEREGRAQVTLDKKQWLLRLVDGALGGRPISEIKPPEVLEALRAIESKGQHETARRARSTIGSVFRYAIATGRAELDPTQPLRGALTAPKVTHRAAITDPERIGALLRSIDESTAQPHIRAALRLAPLLFVRPGELRMAEWSAFDLAAAVWSIPAAQTKMRRPHKVPLSRQALAILRELHSLTGAGRLLFPSVRSAMKPISENTLNKAIQRLGYSGEEMCSHGFRTMAATRLNEMCRWQPDVIERQLAHQDKNAIRRAYTHAVEYWRERIELMQVWADYLDDLKSGITRVTA